MIPCYDVPRHMFERDGEIARGQREWHARGLGATPWIAWKNAGGDDFDSAGYARFVREQAPDLARDLLGEETTP